MILPNSGNFQLPQRYPWMIEGLPNEKPVSWEVSFARSGLPLRVAPSNRSVRDAEVAFVKSSPIDYRSSDARQSRRPREQGTPDGQRKSAHAAAHFSELMKRGRG